MPICIFVLSLIGFWISFYFTGVTYRWFSPNVRWIPPICRMDKSACEAILRTPQARIFGIPNSLLGMVLYAYLLADVFWFPPVAAVAVLTLAAAVSLWLTYQLVVVIRRPCLLCYTSHIINAVLFVLVLVDAGGWSALV